MKLLIVPSAAAGLDAPSLGTECPRDILLTFADPGTPLAPSSVDAIVAATADEGARLAEAFGMPGFLWVCAEPSAAEALAALRAGASDWVDAGPGLLERVRTCVERRKAREHARNQTLLTDPISGVFGHALLHETLDREMATAQRQDRPLSLVLLDIDGFADINERSGYGIGDRLLRGVGDLLLAVTSETRQSDLVARLGGDRFAVVLLDTDKRGAAVLANRLRTTIERHDFGEGLSLTVSIGVASRSDGAGERTALLRMTSAALTGAKRRGRNRVMTYAPVLEEDAPQVAPSLAVEIDLFNALEESIEQGLFRSVYQPIVDAKTLQPRAFEALCRPAHAAFPGPYQLFQVAERAGRIAELGRATRRIATQVVDDLPADTLLFLNLHPRELNRALEEELTSLFAGKARSIVLEVTESAELPDTDFHKGLIRRLKEFGFRVALDDLGAGYAGLNSLSSLEPDIVKLDMELVRGIHEDRRSARLVRHIIDFADEEGILVVAEGVETAEEAKAAIGLGCHLLQGYFFAKPGPPFPQVHVALP